MPYAYIESGSSKALFLARKLKHKMNRPLAAILTLNTLANTLGAAGVGAEAHKLYGSVYVTVLSIALTLTILFVAEIIPKTLGDAYCRQLLPFAVYAIQFMIWLFYPFVVFSDYINRAFKVRRIVTREEIAGAARQGVGKGAIYKNEGALIVNILNLKKKKVLEIMTPRTVITAFKKGTTIKEIIKKHQPLRFARIPVYDESLEQVIGLIHRYKILEANLQGCSHITVENYLKPVHSIPETMSVTAALDQFIKRKEHIFIVVDEYGSVSGLVTMEDVVETILGAEIVDELDSVADMREQARKQWQQRKQKSKGFSSL